MSLLEPGEKVHVIERRLFNGDARRHFIGQVESVADNAFRATGYVFVGNPMTASFDRREPARTRIIPLVSPGVILNIIPQDVDITAARYDMAGENRLVVRSSGWQMFLDEFA